jgi:hypothetical protein
LKGIGGKKGMVQNTNQILDAGEIKICPEVINMTEIRRIDKLIRRSQLEYIKPDPMWDSDEDDYIHLDEIRNEDYKPNPNGVAKKWIEADDIMMNPDIAKFQKERILADPNLKKSLYGFLGLIPFNPCVMINISPNWKGKVDPKDYHWQALLADTIQNYLKSCNRYTKWQYCLECGSDGDFLHAHIVAEINPAIHKSVLTHINKGNHKYELIKQFKKLKGDEGLLKGKFAVQRILLNTETLRDDKLKYLIETNKPDGHQNKYDMDLVVGDFITSKE